MSPTPARSPRRLRCSTSSATGRASSVGVVSWLSTPSLLAPLRTAAKARDGNASAATVAIKTMIASFNFSPWAGIVYTRGGDGRLPSASLAVDAVAVAVALTAPVGRRRTGRFGSARFWRDAPWGGRGRFAAQLLGFYGLLVGGVGCAARLDRTRTAIGRLFCRGAELGGASFCGAACGAVSSTICAACPPAHGRGGIVPRTQHEIAGA
jgi:hypothetical protein